jgi:hypothetical protein
MRFVFLVVLLPTAFVFADPTTQPVMVSVTSAEVRLAAATAQAEHRLTANPDYIAAIATEKSAEINLDEARDGGDPEVLLDATTRHSNALLAVKKVHDDFVATDPGVITAKAALVSAEAAQVVKPKPDPDLLNVVQTSLNRSAIYDEEKPLIPTTRPEISAAFLDSLAPSPYTTFSDYAEARRILMVKRLAAQLKNDADRAERDTTGDMQARVVVSRKKLDLLAGMQGQYVPDLEPMGVGGIGTWAYPSATVVQVLDESNMLVSVPNLEGLFWLQGFSTTGVVDGDEVAPVGCLLIKSTKQYETAIGGTNTVPVIEPVDLTDYFSSPHGEHVFANR